MNPDKNNWNVRLLEDIFPTYLLDIILSISIFVGQQDKLIWCPTISGTFSVRSSY